MALFGIRQVFPDAASLQSLPDSVAAELSAAPSTRDPTFPFILVRRRTFDLAKDQLGRPMERHL